MSVYPYGDRKCGTTRLVVKSAQPTSLVASLRSDPTVSAAFLDAMRRKLGLKPTATRHEIADAIEALPIPPEL